MDLESGKLNNLRTAGWLLLSAASTAVFRKRDGKAMHCAITPKIFFIEKTQKTLVYRKMSDKASMQTLSHGHGCQINTKI